MYLSAYVVLDGGKLSSCDARPRVDRSKDTGALTHQVSELGGGGVEGGEVLHGGRRAAQQDAGLRGDGLLPDRVGEIGEVEHGRIGVILRVQG